jgi:hypothetical protein
MVARWRAPARARSWGRPEFCSTGAYDQPETCPPFDFAKTFKTACPSAYSYAYDDTTNGGQYGHR